ncbi:ABC transporter ATP-binding protein [Martelella alba]
MLNPPEDHVSEAVLELRDLSISFSGPALPDLVDQVSFSVRGGEMLCIVGESGCGKSLTSLAIMGLLSAPRMVGEIRVAGRDLLKVSERVREDIRGKEIAMIFQEPMTSLNPSYTVGYQIGEAIRRHRPGSRADIRDEVIDMLRRVGVPAPERRFHAYPHQMSGGQRQRIMIAMALINNPKLLIADEPTTALDVTIQAQILDLMKEMQRETGTAVVMITHDLRVVAEVADRLVVMYAGRIVESGTTAAIFEDPMHPYTIGLFGAMPTMGARAGRLATIDGNVPAPADFPVGCRFAPRCPFASARCFAEKPPMTELGNGHSVACFHAPIEESMTAIAEELSA